MTRLVLVPSPFVGVTSWGTMAQVLPDALAADYGGVHGPDWYEGVAARIVAQADGRPWVAVLHSGAGGFVPAIAAASSDLVGAIYLDAVLPYPGRNCLQNAPSDLVDQLRRLTTDGWLAPWNRWFEPDPLQRLIPDAGTRAAFVADQPRVPFAFLEAVSRADSAWEAMPAAYVQLSRAYDDTAAQAERLGWSVRRARMHHLAMVSDPDKVATLLTDTLSNLVGA